MFIGIGVPPPSAIGHSAQSRKRNFLNLLIVDDDRTIREGCREVAQSLGFNTQVAGVRRTSLPTAR